MQQCAQCSKSAASSSASRLVAAFEMELPSWLQHQQQDAHAVRSRRRNRQPAYSGRREHHHARVIHGEQDAGSAMLGPGSDTGGPFSMGTQRHVYSKKKHTANTAHNNQQHVPRRSLSTSARATREGNTQAQFIERPDTPNKDNAEAVASSSSASPVQSDRRSQGKSSGSFPHASTSEQANPSSSSSSKAEDKSSSKGNPEVHHLQYLTEEVVQSTNENSKLPRKDEINTLLAYPTLYDPIRKPRHPIVLCHGLYGFDSWGLELLPALK